MRFVYIEDEQMYHHNHVLMESDHPTSGVELERISWEPTPAGRFSTSAETLIEYAANHGVTLRVIDRREQSKRIPKEWQGIPVVKGATGNY